MYRDYIWCGWRRYVGGGGMRLYDPMNALFAGN